MEIWMAHVEEKVDWSVDCGVYKEDKFKRGNQYSNMEKRSKGWGARARQMHSDQGHR